MWWNAPLVFLFFLPFFNLFSSLATAWIHVLQKKPLPSCPPFVPKVCSLFPFSLSGLYSSTRQIASFRPKQKASQSLIPSDTWKWENTISESVADKQPLSCRFNWPGEGLHALITGFPKARHEHQHFFPGEDQGYPAEGSHLGPDFLDFKNLIF